MSRIIPVSARGGLSSVAFSGVWVVGPCAVFRVLVGIPQVYHVLLVCFVLLINIFVKIKAGGAGAMSCRLQRGLLCLLYFMGERGRREGLSGYSRGSLLRVPSVFPIGPFFF